MLREIFKNIKEKLFENKKLAFIIILGLCGIILICISEVSNTKTVSDEVETQSNAADETEYVEKLEERLTDIISSIEYAGQVKVMVTLKGSNENVYAVNENIKNDENSNNYSNNYVIIDNKNIKEGIRIKVLEPEIRGVAVVCTGGDNPQVVEQITKAVTTVLGIGSNKVSVSKMK